MSVLKGSVKLQNLNLKSDKINERIGNSPMKLRAGILQNLEVNFSLFNIFSHALQVKVDEILLIVGTDTSRMAKPEDYSFKPEEYSLDDELKNLVKMHERVYQIWQEEDRDKYREMQKEEVEAAQKIVDDKKVTETNKGKVQPKPKKASKDPPINLLISLLGNVKFEINKIHVRFEDDYFSPAHPYSLGLTIDGISMETVDNWLKFESPLAATYSRQPAPNRSCVFKEFMVKNVRVYWNSMSEMFVPTSVYDQTKQLKYQIFEAIEASFIRDMMIESFNAASKQVHHNLVHPFTLLTSLNFNKSYNRDNDPFKYQITNLLSPIKVSLDSEMVRDLYCMLNYQEVYTYQKVLKKYRPLIPISHFIDHPPKNPAEKRFRRLVIRDWFKMSVWYLRLKKGQGRVVPTELVTIDYLVHSHKIKNPIMKVQIALAEKYIPIIENHRLNLGDQLEQAAAEIVEEYGIDFEEEIKQLQEAKKLRDLVSGCKFGFWLEEFRFQVVNRSKPILAPRSQFDSQLVSQPNLEFILSMFSIVVKLFDSNIDFEMNLVEMKLLQSVRRPPKIKLKTQVSHRDFLLQNSSQVFDYNSNQNQNVNKSTFAMLGDAVADMWNPDGRRTAQSRDGANDRPQSRLQKLMSPGGGGGTSKPTQKAFDYFNSSLPEENEIQQRTNASQTIRGTLDNFGRLSNAQKSTFYNAKKNKDVTPTKKTKIAHKYHSPGDDRSMDSNVCNHPLLNCRCSEYKDHRGEKVEKRCIFTLCGSDINPSGISMILAANLLEDPGEKKHIGLRFVVDNVITEQCNEVIKHMIGLAMGFQEVFSIGSLRPNSKKYPIERKILHLVPIMILRNKLLNKAIKATIGGVKAYQQALRNDEKPDPVEVKIRIKKNEEKTIKSIKNLDAQLEDLNFSIEFLINNVYFGMVGDKDDIFVPGLTLLEFGIERQAIRLEKQDFRCKSSLFGITLTTLNSYEMIFSFVKRLQKQFKQYEDALAIQTTIAKYKEYVSRHNMRSTEPIQLRKASTPIDSEHDDEDFVYPDKPLFGTMSTRFVEESKDDSSRVSSPIRQKACYK